MRKNNKILNKKEFSKAIEMLPLISIDFCLIYKQKILLGKRNNEPAKDFLFTPGGRIRKNEPYLNAFERIFFDELNTALVYQDKLRLMGIWDHFYDKSAFDKNISTHYINLPYLYRLSKKEFDNLKLLNGANEQHSKWIWIDMNDALDDQRVHKYIKKNIKWILENIYD